MLDFWATHHELGRLDLVTELRQQAAPEVVVATELRKVLRTSACNVARAYRSHQAITEGRPFDAAAKGS